jgi:hypothetical protein
LAILVAGRAQAIINVYTPDNDVPIGEDPAWTGGDPGWDSVTVSGTNYTYIGDNWVLAARHTGVSTAQFSTGSFAPIPGQDFVVPNPTDWPVTLSTESDLRLFRINGDPGVAAIPLASQPPPVNGQVVFIGQGHGRAASMTNWQVNTTDPDNWIWTEVQIGGNYHGYKSGGADVKRWGTNKISTDEIFGTSNDNDADWDRVIEMKGGGGIVRDAITLLTVFDRTGGTAQESQAIGGDSGSAMFYKPAGGEWQLAGVVSAVLTYPNQSSSWGVFGDVTAISDVSAYYDEIYSIVNSHREYSVMGDVNLNGSVSGDGTGDPATDDVAAFVAGWMYDNGTGAGDIASWQKGDLNLDGKTDVNDFLLMRSVLNMPASGSLDALLGVEGVGGVSAVPEPATVVLMLIGALLMLGFRK